VADLVVVQVEDDGGQTSSPLMFRPEEKEDENARQLSRPARGKTG
jgi:hypothetical protein